MKSKFKIKSRENRVKTFKKKIRSEVSIWDLPKIMAKIPYPKKPYGLSDEDKIIYGVED